MTSMQDLTVSVINVTVALQRVLKDIRNYPNEIVELKTELVDVQTALRFLHKAAAHNKDDLLELEPVLSHCGEACQRFLDLVNKCSAETTGKLAAFFGSRKLHGAKGDITRLRNVLCSLKSTTTLKLGGITLNRFAVNAAAVDEYQRLVIDAVAETERNLRQINSQLQSFSKQHPHTNDQDFEQWQQLQANKTRCENDLNAFSEVLAHLQKVELDKLDTILNNPDANEAVLTTLERPAKERLSIANIQEFMEKVPQAMVDLKSHLSSIENEMRSFPKVDWQTRQTLQADKQTEEHRLNILRQCNDKAEKKQTNIFKDVRAAKRAHQAIISDVGELFDCNNVTAGPGARQLLGQYSGEFAQSFWLGEDTVPSRNGTPYQKGTFQKHEWIDWRLVAMCASSGAVAWMLSRGLI